jgi:CDP-diacylglycerol--glycerol-3-phosphate 3-phosphatidyltransferase
MCFILFFAGAQPRCLESVAISMLSEKLGHRLDGPLTYLIVQGPMKRLSPTALTLTGLFFNLVAAGVIIWGWWKSAALIILFAGLFDMLDGATARVLEKTTRFGGFLDSVIDRYSDMAILIAFIIYYALQNDIFMVSLCSITSIGCVLIPYTRARAEAIIPTCNIGIMERAERIILIVAGCYLNLMKPVFLILAILTHVTVLQRIYYTWQHTDKPSQ